MQTNQIVFVNVTHKYAMIANGFFSSLARQKRVVKVNGKVLNKVLSSKFYIAFEAHFSDNLPASGIILR